MTETVGSTETPERGQPELEQKKRRGPLSRAGLFYRQIVAELRKVIWPTRNELVTYTTVVIAFVVVIMAIVFAVDYGFTQAVTAVFG